MLVLINVLEFVTVMINHCAAHELKRYSAHSLRVWACALLDEAGKLPDYIKKRLCWLGDTFRMYLKDTAIIQP
jgi:hypothetical protein